MFRRWQANRAYKRILKAMERDYSRVKDALQSHDDFQDWVTSWDAEIEIARVAYDEFRTSHWRQKAIDKLVELPARDEKGEFWHRSPVSGNWVLTDKGVATIRAAVRQETLASTELCFRVGLIAAALIGAASGIGSILAGLSRQG